MFDIRKIQETELTPRRSMPTTVPTVLSAARQKEHAKLRGGERKQKGMTPSRVLNGAPIEDRKACAWQL